LLRLRKPSRKGRSKDSDPRGNLIEPCHRKTAKEALETPGFRHLIIRSVSFSSADLGGAYGILGYLAAVEADTRKHVWRMARRGLPASAIAVHELKKVSSRAKRPRGLAYLLPLSARDDALLRRRVPYCFTRSPYLTQ